MNGTTDEIGEIWRLIFHARERWATEWIEEDGMPDEWERGDELATEAVELGIRTGEFLAEVKAEREGEGFDWSLWLDDNLPFSYEQAERYIAAFEDRDRLRGLRPERAFHELTRRSTP